MKAIHKTLVLITVTLTASAVSALAGTAQGQPASDAAAKAAAPLDQLPHEVQSGSVQVKKDDEQAMAAQASVTAAEAAKVAAGATNGKVLATKLDDENGYLIWEVEVLDPQGKETQIKIDAGNGSLLAAEINGEGEHGDGDRDEHRHSSWKFWEDKDDGAQGDTAEE
jgi:uncharacterized membrane protein YkoI